MSLPPLVTQQEWLAARKEPLARESENTRQRDAINADRRRLPMTVVAKDYRFEGPAGDVGLGDLFGGCRQLIIQHVMFGPGRDAACPAALDGLAVVVTAATTASGTLTANPCGSLTWREFVAPMSKLIAGHSALSHGNSSNHCSGEIPGTRPPVINACSNECLVPRSAEKE